MRILITLMLLTAVTPSPKPQSLKTNLTFLTRDGCVNTPDMVNSLEDALKALGWPHDYQYVNISKLKSTDVRSAYPTPTLLWKGHDIYGMPVPKPPYDVPS